MSLLVSRTAEPTSAAGENVGPTRYDADRYSWALEQIEFLKSGRIDALDLANLVEELRDVAGSEYEKLESALAIVLLHLLKWDHQPARRSRSWVLSIKEHRRRVERQLRHNPSLKPRFGEAIEEAYEFARIRCEKETSVETDSLPWSCPYDWDEIMTREISWPIVEPVRS